MTRLAKFGLISTIIVFSFFVVFVGAGDWVDCKFHNISIGHFRSKDFTAHVSITRDQQATRIDLTKIPQSKRVCAVSMYAVGEPYSLTDSNVRLNQQKACWRDTAGKITLAAVSDDGTPNWFQLALGVGPELYQIRGENCADVNTAVLLCAGDICSFDAALLK